MNNYKEKLQSRFYGIMDWVDCQNIFDFLSENPQDWYLYNIDELTPSSVLNDDEFVKKITEINNTIKELHKERYCGIIYADDLKKPTMVKIFHPNNLGKSCGSSENPPLPQWVISKIKPETIAKPVEKSRGFVSKFFNL
jgi:galactose-1-phosphate uridylyltransferase